MPRPGQISLKHFCIEVFLVAVAVALVCQAISLWHDEWAHEFVISPLLYGALASLVIAADGLRRWSLAEPPDAEPSR